MLEGLSAGERVVVAANFLIDAEGNLKAALEGFAAGAPGQGCQVIARLIEASARNALIVVLATLFVIGAGIWR